VKPSLNLLGHDPNMGGIGDGSDGAF